MIYIYIHMYIQYTYMHMCVYKYVGCLLLLHWHPTCFWAKSLRRTSSDRSAPCASRRTPWDRPKLSPAPSLSTPRVGRNGRNSYLKLHCNEAPDATTAVNPSLIEAQQKYCLLYSIPIQLIQRRGLPHCYPSCFHSEIWATELSHDLDEQGLYTAGVIPFHDRRHLRWLHAEWHIMKLAELGDKLRHKSKVQVLAQLKISWGLYGFMTIYASLWIMDG